MLRALAGLCGERGPQLCAFVGIALAAAVITRFGVTGTRNTPPRRVADDYIVVNDRDLDFGLVWSQPSFRRTIHLTNVSSDAVELQVSATTCSCVAISPARLRIPARGTGELTMSLDLMGANDSDLAAPRSFSAGVLVEVMQPVRARLPLSVTGTVRDCIQLSPTRIEVTDELYRNGPPASRAIQIRCAPEVRRLAVEATPVRVAAVLTPREGDGAARQYELAVQIHETSKVGLLRSEVVLAGYGDGGQEICRVPIEIRGTVHEDVLFQPSYVAFGILGFGD